MEERLLELAAACSGLGTSNVHVALKAGYIPNLQGLRVTAHHPPVELLQERLSTVSSGGTVAVSSKLLLASDYSFRDDTMCM